MKMRAHGHVVYSPGESRARFILSLLLPRHFSMQDIRQLFHATFVPQPQLFFIGEGRGYARI